MHAQTKKETRGCELECTCRKKKSDKKKSDERNVAWSEVKKKQTNPHQPHKPLLQAVREKENLNWFWRTATNPLLWLCAGNTEVWLIKEKRVLWKKKQKERNKLTACRLACSGSRRGSVDDGVVGAGFRHITCSARLNPGCSRESTAASSTLPSPWQWLCPF